MQPFKDEKDLQFQSSLGVLFWDEIERQQRKSLAQGHPPSSKSFTYVVAQPQGQVLNSSHHFLLCVQLSHFIKENEQGFITEQKLYSSSTKYNRKTC